MDPLEGIPHLVLVLLLREIAVGCAQQSTEVALSHGRSRTGVMKDNPRQIIRHTTNRPKLIARHPIVQDGQTKRPRNLSVPYRIMTLDVQEKTQRLREPSKIASHTQHHPTRQSHLAPHVSTVDSFNTKDRIVPHLVAFYILIE